MVYEFAITSESESVTFVDGKIGYIDLYSQTRSVNELQYVSKQLRAETIGLTLKFNKCVRFNENDSFKELDIEQAVETSKSVTECLKFLKACTPTSISKLATILIEMPEPHISAVLTYLRSWRNIVSELSKFCIANPHALVKISVTKWYLDESATHGPLDTSWFYETNYKVKRTAAWGRLGSASNLRVFPFGSLPDQGLLSHSVPLTSVPLRWLAEIKKVYADGISSGDFDPAGWIALADDQ
ncbi:hypothetical protein BU16DRAFT_609936 [Lophium mytilinum]|uniref:Uncharacterized protein n=1 Tax=Lophium mytilinum TaxID=390894 RepID=A0A6A6QSN4_9PEZI|nr:hypothetical protein BU16DRAFT_609936 [Lophium mytilinum]